MALTRINAFATGTILTNGQLTGEFDNIYNNALTLISPLTANLSFGGFNANNIALGSAASPSINWTGNTNTGLYSAGANQVSIAVAGVGAASFTTAAAGPHVIGSATTNTRYALNLTGTVTLSGATQEAGFASDQALTNASGVNLYGMYLAPTLTNVAGATTTMAWLGIVPGALTITAGSVTNAAGVYISGAPSGATNNYALWVAGGNIRVGTATSITSAADGLGGPTILLDPASLIFYGGTTNIRWLNQARNAERMQLTDAGILLLGTTVSTGSVAGNLTLANATGIMGVNAAGTSAIEMIRVGGAGNNVILANAGGDIQWGRALIALGAGAAATLGNIGGAGPGTAGQNTWMRVLDSAGAAFWVPAWK